MGMLEGKVALVTGAGGGLGRAHAKLLAKEGAKVIVNDLGGSRDGTGAGSSMADEVVSEIQAAGGEACANYGSVTDKTEAEQMVKDAVNKYGALNILIANAGILRDKSFKNMTEDMWDIILDVHLRGTYLVTKFAYDEMVSKGNGGRIIMTSSTSGLLGNFGQTNYGAAKMGLIGFMNTLVLEGGKYNIHVNALSPTANTRMTEDLLPAPMLDLMTAESVTAGALTLCHDNAPNRTILCCGAGGYAKASIYETDGIFISKKEQTPENVIENWESLTDPTNHKALEAGGKQTEKFIMKAMSALQN